MTTPLSIEDHPAIREALLTCEANLATAFARKVQNQITFSLRSYQQDTAEGFPEANVHLESALRACKRGLAPFFAMKACRLIRFAVWDMPAATKAGGFHRFESQNFRSWASKPTDEEPCDV